VSQLAPLSGVRWCTADHANRGDSDHASERHDVMHEIHVSVMSPEAADHGVAELWTEEEFIGYTLLEDGDLMLRIEPRRDGTAVVVGARSLAVALARAGSVLDGSDSQALRADLALVGDRQRVPPGAHRSETSR
jgi:hypothetical protein